ncbi:hypothetical protein [Streptomyces beijiangensis]|uniref:Uncharacterized protein n=1 Tax=Streptomyces beijiangensis TaxID=163361 RepID=A0A939F774_9ACTN|nr:hypothetical protein [Streptomyces beijiangensis]MBO0513610.1 hypothetical protein [Streptomyces beijiangensis]
MAVAVLLAGGCGIRSTDVVEVGAPATAQIGTPGREGPTLYFQGPDGLMPVVRPYGEEVGPGKVFAMLMAGPTAAERVAGLRTELPSFQGFSELMRSQGGVLIRLHGPVRGLSAVARQQLVCTAAHFGGKSGITTVRINGTDGDIGAESCLV